MSNGNGSIANIADSIQPNAAEVTDHILGLHRSTGPRFKLLVAMLTVLFLLGVVGFLIRLLGDGLSENERIHWGYYAAVVSFLLSTAAAAPMVAIATRMANAHWRRPFTRISELFAVVGIFTLLLYIPLLWLLPSIEGRRSIWFEARAYSPHVWDTLAIAFLVICGLALLWADSRPDMAVIRDHSEGRRQRLFSKLSLNWLGTDRQWFLLKHRVGALSALYFMFLIFTHILFSSDFSMSLVPGWRDAVFPVHQGLSSLQAGLALTIVAMFVLRQWGGFRAYLGLELFWGLSKLLLALSLLWFWFWWSGFIVYWYGRQPAEANVLELLVSGTYQPIFMLTFVLTFLVPLFVLVWNAVRKTFLGPTVVAVSVLIGIFFDRVRYYVAAFSVEDPSAHALEVVPSSHMPDGADILIIIGGLAGALLVFTLATKLFPLMSIWEVKEYLTLRVHQRFYRREVTLVAKPE